MSSSEDLDMCRGLNYNLKPSTPTISKMPAQKVVTITIQGDPNKETARVMPPLYASAYAIRKCFKEKNLVFKVEKLRGRWPDANMKCSKDQWTGTYALPVPNDTRALEEIKPEKKVPGVEVKLTTWEYGDVGQILHEGPYTEEGPTIQKLYQYIQSQGWRPLPNSHEEIYISDPSKTPPNKMKTLLLCRITK